MARYKRYLYSRSHDGKIKIPRSTLHSQRKLKREAELRLLQQNVINTQQEGCVTNSVSNDSHGNVVEGCDNITTFVNATAHQQVVNPGQMCAIEAVCEENLPQGVTSVREVDTSTSDSDELETETSRLQEVGENTDADSNITEDISQHISETSEDKVDDISNIQRNTPKVTPPPLSSYTECTADDVFLMCLTLGMRHNLSWECQVDILKMVNVICGDKKVNASKYSSTKELLRNENLDMTHHVYCSDCKFYIGKTEYIKGCVLCSNCGSDVDVAKKENYFMSLSLQSQLKSMLANSEIADAILTYRFNRARESVDSLSDIYDGSEYLKHFDNGGILSCPYTFSYTFFTDGVRLGNSKKTLWPIYVTINELPRKERSKFVLLCGLYVGSEDPKQSFFMKPFVQQANDLSTEGFSWLYKGDKVHSKVIPLVGVADSVARCKLMEMQTFSAWWGCTFCYQNPTRTRSKLKYTIPPTPAQDRTLESTKADLKETFERRYEKLEKNRQCRGVKGPSALLEMKYFDMCTGMVVDYMHNILLGCVKTHLTLIFDSTNRKFWPKLSEERYAIDDILSEIDQRLLTIKPPSSITRTPRSIKDYTHFKASEFRSFLLFYCIPCLTGLLKEKYLIHLAMLSKATYLLLQNSVTREEVQEAHTLFMSYTFYFQKYFGEEHMYYNIHLLKHICKGVLRWGPLWTHNAFVFEGRNRYLLQLCKNPKTVVKEISQRYLVFQSFPNICDKFACTEGTLLFCEEVLEQNLVRYVRTGSCLLLGKGEKQKVSLQEEQCLLQSGLLNPQDCVSYSRMLYKGMRISTFNYTIGKKNNDSFIYMINGEFFVVRRILHSPVHGLVILVEDMPLMYESVLSYQTLRLNVKHIRMFKMYGNLHCVKVSIIVGQCVVSESALGTYISKMPFGCYGD